MKTIAIVSDLHIGSSLGLCDGKGMDLGEGGIYLPSKLQQEVYRAWVSFFEWVENESIGAESTTLVINGDSVDGFHHNTVALATNNIEVQEHAAIELLRPVVKKFDNFYMTRGTEAHVQASAQSEERIAQALHAIPSEDGQHSWWQLWLDVDGVIFNIAHHIGTTSSSAYESSAVMRELVAALVEAGQWGQHLPDVLVRSHRHRCIELGIPGGRGKIQAVVTPGWQLRTPFVERIDRMRLPHIGGLLFRVENGQCQIKTKIYPMKTQAPVKL
jgi:hypothetical protein